MRQARWSIVALALAVAPACVTPAKEDPSVYHDSKRLAGLIAERRTDWHLVDVRTPAEYAEGHLPTAINIPHTEIASRLPTEDRQALIVVYCRSGARSATAKGILESLGFSRVVDFGTVSRWGGELVRGAKPD